MICCQSLVLSLLAFVVGPKFTTLKMFNNERTAIMFWGEEFHVEESGFYVLWYVKISLRQKNFCRRTKTNFCRRTKKHHVWGRKTKFPSVKDVKQCLQEWCVFQKCALTCYPKMGKLLSWDKYQTFSQAFSPSFLSTDQQQICPRTN